ncbi:MAG: hypothetical protein AB7P03_19545 [Kofleriaceae bacterium]
MNEGKSPIAMVATIAGVMFAIGCTDDVDQAWELDHDRIIAVRATPPRIITGERSEIDLLLGRTGRQVPIEISPEAATVVSPMALAGALSGENGEWIVTAPTNDELAMARTELALPADAPVPVQVGVSSNAGELLGLKMVWIGEQRQNPSLDTVTMNAADITGATELSVGIEVDVRFEVPFDDENFDINWLTSCGTMHDYDLPSAYLRVEKDDMMAGTFALVVRDAFGGVAWRLWQITAN